MEQRMHHNNDETRDPKNRYPDELMRRFELYFKTPHTEKFLSVRQVKANHIGKLILVKGVVTRATEVKPMISVATYTCDICGSETYQPVSRTIFSTFRFFDEVFSQDVSNLFHFLSHFSSS